MMYSIKKEGVASIDGMPYDVEIIGSRRRTVKRWFGETEEHEERLVAYKRSQWSGLTLSFHDQYLTAWLPKENVKEHV